MTAHGKYYKLENLSITVVDDRKSMRLFVADILREVGIGKVLNCAGFADAVKLLDPPEGVENLHGVDFSLSIDMIIIDWLLGDQESGLDLLKWIRGHKSELVKYMPVIVLSGYSERDHILRARDAGANEFLTKPISISRLLNRVLAVIERPRPFIASATFFGPERRRANQPIDFPDRRKTKASETLEEPAA
jgi:DNA-binding response OmpR family regulator